MDKIWQDDIEGLNWFSLSKYLKDGVKLKEPSKKNSNKQNSIF